MSLELLVSLAKYVSLASANHFFLLYSGKEENVNALPCKTNSILMFCHNINLFSQALCENLYFNSVQDFIRPEHQKYMSHRRNLSQERCLKSSSYTTGCTYGDVPIEVSDIWSSSVSYILWKVCFC